MQVCIELAGQTHSSCFCTRKASWDEQGTNSRRVHTTLLRGRIARHRRPRLVYIVFNHFALP
jgi:hypothetical protein